MVTNELNFNHLIIYLGALHLWPQRQSFFYKYYGALHLLGLFFATTNLQIVGNYAFWVFLSGSAS